MVMRPIIDVIRYILGYAIGAPLKFLQAVRNKANTVYLVVHLGQGAFFKAFMDKAFLPLSPDRFVSTLIIGTIALAISYGAS